MQTYCLSCRKHTDNIGPRKVIIANKVVRQTWKCANCVAKKSRFLKLFESLIKKLVRIILILNFSYTNQSKTCWHVVWSAKKYKKWRSKSVKN